MAQVLGQLLVQRGLDHDFGQLLGGIMQALKDADPADKAEIYRRIGLTLTYHPQEKRVAAEARPNSIMYVGTCPRGDLNPHALLGH